MQQLEIVTHAPVEILATQFSMADLVAKSAMIEELLKTSFIPTNRYSEYARWLDELRILKHCGRVIGLRDVGKSRSSDHYQDEDRKHVCYIIAKANLSSNRLFSSILKEINHAAWRGKSKDLQSRLAGCLELFGIELLLIDEADNLQEEALIDLKQLHEKTRIPIVLIGRDKLDDKLQDGDFLTCFPWLFNFDALDDGDLQKTLETIELDILTLPQASNLSAGNIFEILAISSNARIGKLIEILSKTVIHSLMKGHGKIDMTILKNISDSYGTHCVPAKRRNKQQLSSDIDN